MELGCDENDLRNVELAARLHALELIGSNELRGVSGMREVEEIIRWARRGGSPARTMPTSAQIVAAASGYDLLTAAPAETRFEPDAALVELRGDGRRYRRDVIEALGNVVSGHRGGSQRPRRRRRRDERSIVLPAVLEAPGAA
jgi:hypothetical protein